jgi:hypothetical protein
MPAPEHLLNIIKGVHSDAVVTHGSGSVQAVQARELIALLDGIPPVPVSDLLRDALRDFVDYVQDAPDGFRVGGTNTPDALTRRFVEWQEERGFDVPEGTADGEPAAAPWNEVLGHSR